MSISVVRADSLDDVSDTDLVELPLYETKGDMPANNPFAFTEKSIAKKNTNKSSDACKEKSKPYTKKRDSFRRADGSIYINEHDGFPYVSSVPTIDDQFNVGFFKEKSSQEFFLTKWSDQTFPLVIFHVSEESKAYYPQIKSAIDLLNSKAKNLGLVKSTEKLVDLSSEFIPLDQNDCNTHIIHADEQAVGGTTNLHRTFDDPNRVGQIYDADIIVGSPKNPLLYPGDKLQYAIEHNDKKLLNDYFKMYFSRTVIHEILHALGLTHNFAHADAMDYLPRTLAQKIIVGEGPNDFQHMQFFDLSMSHEIQSLKFLYGKSYVKDKVNWPVTRSINPETVLMKPDQKNTSKMLIANVDQKNSTFACTNMKTKSEKNLNNVISKTFQLLISSSPYPGLTDNSFVGMGIVELYFYNPVAGAEVSVRDTHRIFPMIDLSKSQNFSAEVGNQEVTLLNKTTKIVLASNFTSAFTPDTLSSIDWMMHVQGLDCELKLKFTLQE